MLYLNYNCSSVNLTNILFLSNHESFTTWNYAPLGVITNYDDDDDDDDDDESLQ